VIRVLKARKASKEFKVSLDRQVQLVLLDPKVTPGLLVILDQLDHKVTLELLDLPELRGCRASKVLRDCRVYRETLALLELKVLPVQLDQMVHHLGFSGHMPLKKNSI
jgi:hypothetical protein